MGGDIDAMLSPASLIGPYANMIKESDMPFNMKDLKMLGSLSFEKGKISMKYENSLKVLNCKPCSISKRKQPAP